MGPKVIELALEVLKTQIILLVRSDLIKHLLTFLMAKIGHHLTDGRHWAWLWLQTATHSLMRKVSSFQPRHRR